MLIIRITDLSGIGGFYGFGVHEEARILMEIGNLVKRRFIRRFRDFADGKRLANPPTP